MAAPNTPKAKTERLMNLTMCLLGTRRALTKETIRSRVEGYRDVASDEAFDRMFERDKEELREMGIPVVTETIDLAFEDEVGYRIDSRDYELPEIELAPDELAVIGLASRTWTSATLRGPALEGWRKVSAAEELGDDPFVGLQPQLMAAEPSFDALRAAAMSGSRVRFTYLKVGSSTGEERHVEPWGLTSWHGRWYLTGHDLNRGGPRVFRLSRVTGEVVSTGEPVEHEPPPGFDAVAMIRGAQPEGPERVRAVLRVRHEAGLGLRRRAVTVEAADPGWDRLEVESGTLEGLADEVVGYGPSVVVVEPPELVETVVELLRGALAAHEGGPA